MIVVGENASTRIDVRSRQAVMLQHCGKQRGAESFTIRRDFVMRLQIRSGDGEQSKNLSLAVINQFAKRPLLFSV